MESSQKNQLIEGYAQEQKSNNKVKEMMLSVIGHDLRSLFNVLMGNAASLLKNIQQQHIASLEKEAAQLNSSSKNAYLMMDGLMQWVSLQKGKNKEELVNIDINNLVQTTIKPLQPILEASAVKLRLEVDSVSIRSDFNLLQIVLRNLLTNAIKHSSVDGVISIQTKILNPQQLVLMVSDNGAGIDSALLEDLFLPKERLKTAAQGHGLGLQLVKEICDSLELPIKAYNKEPMGAVFELVLPIEDGQATKTLENGSLEPLDLQQELSKQDFLFLQPYIQKLLSLEVFEATPIQRLLDEMNENSPSIAVKNWMAKLSNAVYHGDSDSYLAILKKTV